MENEYFDIINDLLKLDRLIQNKDLCNIISKKGYMKIQDLINYLNNHPLYMDEKFDNSIIITSLEKLPHFKYDSQVEGIFCESWRQIVHILNIEGCTIEDFFQLESIFEENFIFDFIKEHKYYLEKQEIEVQFEIRYETNEKIEEFIKIIESDEFLKTKTYKKLANSLRQFFQTKENNIELEPYEINKNGKMNLNPKKIINYFLEIKEDIVMNQNLLNLDCSRFPIVDFGREPRIEELDPTINDFYTANNHINDFMNFDCQSLKSKSRRNSFKKSSSKSNLLVIN